MEITATMEHMEGDISTCSQDIIPPEHTAEEDVLDPGIPQYTGHAEHVKIRTVVLHRILRTSALFSAYMSMAAVISILGPTLVSMGVLLEESTKTMSTAIAAYSIGYIAGSVLCGFVYDKILSKEMLYVVCVMPAGIVTCVAPVGDSLYSYIAALVVLGVLYGCMDASSQVYVLQLWEGHHMRWRMMILMHIMYMVGATITPFSIKSFLVDIDVQHPNITIEDTFNMSSGNTGTTFPEQLKEKVSIVRYGFIVAGSLAVVPTILFTVAFALLRISTETANKHGNLELCEEQHKGKKEQSKMISVILLILLVMFFFLYFFVFLSNGSMVATFAVKGLGWPNHLGAVVTSVYFACNGLGKVVLIYTFTRIKAATMLMLVTSLTLSGAAVMLLSYRHFSVLWIGQVLFGLGLSCAMVSGYRWIDQYMVITGKLSSLAFTVGSSGLLVGPFLSGFMFDTYGPHAFIYTFLTGCILFFTTSACAVIFAAKYAVKRSLIIEVTKCITLDQCRGNDDI